MNHLLHSAMHVGEKLAHEGGVKGAIGGAVAMPIAVAGTAATVGITTVAAPLLVGAAILGAFWGADKKK